MELALQSRHRRSRSSNNRLCHRRWQRCRYVRLLLGGRRMARTTNCFRHALNGITHSSNSSCVAATIGRNFAIFQFGHSCRQSSRCNRFRRSSFSDKSLLLFLKGCFACCLLHLSDPLLAVDSHLCSSVTHHRFGSTFVGNVCTWFCFRQHDVNSIVDFIVVAAIIGENKFSQR